MDCCLVGWWGDFLVPFLELEFVTKWANHHWLLKGRLGIVVLGRGLFLFE